MNFATLFDAAVQEGWGKKRQGAWTDAALAKRIGVTRSTIGRWRKGECLPTKANLQLALAQWGLPEEQAKYLANACALGHPRRAKKKRSCYDDGVEKREFLLGVGAGLLTPLQGLQRLDESQQRYAQLQFLTESSMPYDLRVSLTRNLDQACHEAARTTPNYQNHSLATMAAIRHALCARPNFPIEAKLIADRARTHAATSGQNLLKVWAAATFACTAHHLGHDQEAVAAIEEVIDLKQERGTRAIFAACMLAESYAALGDTEGVARGIELAERARDNVAEADEFSGRMVFYPEEEWIHCSKAQLVSGNNREAARLALQALEAHRVDESQQNNHRWYLMKASVVAAAAHIGLGDWDAAHEFTTRTLDFAGSVTSPIIHSADVQPLLARLGDSQEGRQIRDMILAKMKNQLHV